MHIYIIHSYPYGADPWHVLSVLKAESEDIKTLLINGTAHCADMYSPTLYDPPSLRQARSQIALLIGQWLAA